jgi:excisionase family DNA binding protein
LTGYVNDVLAYTEFQILEVLTPMNIPPDSILTVQDVADYLRVNQRTVYRLVVDGRLPGFKVGAAWRFKRVDIDAWIQAQSQPARGGEAT